MRRMMTDFRKDRDDRLVSLLSMAAVWKFSCKIDRGCRRFVDGTFKIPLKQDSELRSFVRGLPKLFQNVRILFVPFPMKRGRDVFLWYVLVPGEGRFIVVKNSSPWLGRTSQLQNVD